MTDHLEHMDGETSRDIVENALSAQTAAELEAIAQQARSLAHTFAGDSLALLTVLRVLEELHREIREDLFQPSLPDTRQALYALLRNIEASGGWPYINRMRLNAFLANLDPLAEESSSTTCPYSISSSEGNPSESSV